MRYKQNPKIPAREVGGVLAVITPGTSNIHRLNQVGAWLWQQCDGDGRTAVELIERLVTRYDVEVEQASEDVQAFLEEAQRKNILLYIE